MLAFDSLIVVTLVSLAPFALSGSLHLGCGQQQRADAFRIVGDDFLAQVILIAAIAIRIAAESTDTDRSFEIELAIRISLNKLF